MRVARTISLILLLFGGRLIAQDNNQLVYRGYANRLELQSGDIKVYDYVWRTRKYNIYTDRCRILGDHGIPFLILAQTDQKWLFLSSPYFATVYRNETTSFFMDGTGYMPGLDYIISGGKYTATSFLTEDNMHYTANNLSDDDPSKPWIEGVEGDGIGEKVFINWRWKKGDGGSTGALIISNGFVSYDKPYLYEMNNRVRRIRVSDPAGKFSVEMEVKDTPNPQIIFLPSTSEETEIEILSVYPGTKWHDTCLNYVFGLETTRAVKLRGLMQTENTLQSTSIGHTGETE